MLTPAANDPNREAELVRRREDPCSFGLLSMNLDRLPGYFKDKRGVTERPKPGALVVPQPKKLILPEGVKS